MSDPETPETTTGGRLGQVVGKAKAVVGSLLGKDDLEREGHLQHARAAAELEADRRNQAAELRRREVAVEEQRAEASAERDRLRTELEAEELHERVEENAALRENQIAMTAVQEQAAIRHREELEQRAAAATEEAALHRRAAQAAEVARLQRAAENAEQVADALDPEAK